MVFAAADCGLAETSAKGVGFVAGPRPVPVFPMSRSAILFDNAMRGDKNWGANAALQVARRSPLESLSQHTEMKRMAQDMPRTAGLYPGGSGDGQ